ncbi:MAG: Spy/CpxP family protein refolding chaperone [Proteobacteria bacterium]|nr:Spy/CpxP family protein refolding chaperone [Pseudomonadota bacterium]
MTKKNYLLVTAAVAVFFLVFGPTAALHASDGVVVAQAHQHDHDKDSAKGDDDRRGSYCKDKGKVGGHGHHPGHAMKMRHDYAHVIISHADTLKLTDEQLGKIVRLHLKNKAEHEELKHRLREDMHTFRHESMNPGVSDEQLRSSAKSHIDDFNAMVEHHIKERQAIHAVLSDPQRVLLKSIKADHDHGKKKSGHGDH